jgi:hypothetical protein
MLQIAPDRCRIGGYNYTGEKVYNENCENQMENYPNDGKEAKSKGQSHYTFIILIASKVMGDITTVARNIYVSKYTRRIEK